MEQNLTERQTNVAISDQNGINGHTVYTDNSVAFSNGICMANRDPIDIQFKDITYTVKLGFNKGMHTFLSYLFYFSFT